MGIRLDFLLRNWGTAGENLKNWEAAGETHPQKRSPPAKMLAEIGSSY